MLNKSKIIFQAALVWIAMTEVAFCQPGSCFMIYLDSPPCQFEFNNSRYQISRDGMMKIKSIGTNNYTVKFKLPDSFHIEQVNYQIIDSAILLVFDIDDSEGASSIVAKFDTATKKIKWTTDIGAFNPSPLLIVNNAVYLGCIGTVAKLNFTTGKIIWRHNNLYERTTGAFNSFITPRKEGSLVIFQEKKISTDHYADIRKIHVDDKTGAIIPRK